MIKFFRRIRQKMLAENRFTKYLIYAIGEIVLVVIGILIAIQINNRNEFKKLRNSEKQYLIALMDEFNFNKVEMERAITLNNRNGENGLKLLNTMGSKDPEITEEEIGILLVGSLANEVQFNPNQGVLDEIISSGKLGLFGNNKLKFALSSWKGLMQKLRLQEQELHRLRYITIDMLRNEANLRKLLSPGIESYGIEQSEFKDGNLHLLKSLPFEGHMIGLVTMSKNLNKNEYSKLSEEMDRILLLIDNEIK